MSSVYSAATADLAKLELERIQPVLQYTATKTNGEKLEKFDITSPISGQVLKIYRESEWIVEAGQVLIEVGDPRSLEIEIDVLSADAVQIIPGTKIIFKRWGGEH